MRTISVLLALFLCVGCNRESAPPPKGEKSKEVAKKAIAPPEEPVDSLTAEIRAMTPIAPVDPAVLETFLPPTLGGYSVEELSSATTDFGEHKHSFARRKYDNNGYYLIIDIHDAARIPNLYSDIATRSKLDEDGLDGHHKGVTIDGNPGFEKYDKLNLSGELSVMVGKRYIVTIESNYIAPENLRKTYDGIDVKKLAALK
jgi:hypothetical protein